MSMQEKPPQAESLGFFKIEDFESFRNSYKTLALKLLEEYSSRFGGAFEQFLNTYQPDEEEYENLKTIWDSCFEDKGHLRVARTNEEITKDQDKLLKAYFLAAFGHGFYNPEGAIQHRGTGERYINHPLRCAGRLVEYAYPVWAIAAEINHDNDIREDSLISPEDIECILGKKERRFVEKLEKVRKAQKETDQTATMIKLLQPFLEDDQEGVAAGVAKVADKIDNMGTISGKDPEDQLATAYNTLQVFVPFARILGLKNEAQLLADYSIKVIASLSNLYPSDLIKNLEEEIQSFSPSLIEEIQSYILNRVEMGDVSFLEVQLPGLFELVESGKKDQEVYLKTIVVLKDKVVEERVKNDSRKGEKISREVALAYHANSVINSLNSALRFSEPVNDQIGYTRNYRTAKTVRESILGKRPDFVHNLDYITGKNGNEQRIAIKVLTYGESDYDWETTPLTYLHRFGLSSDELINKQKRIAELKFQSLVGEMLVLRQNSTDDEFVQSVLVNLPDSIGVIEEKETDKGLEYSRKPIAQGGTLLDYLFEFYPDSWRRFLNAKVNDEDVGIDYVLNNGDRINPKFGDETINNVEVHWFDSGGFNQEEKRKEIAVKILERIVFLRRLENNQELPKEERVSYRQKLEELEVSLINRGARKFEPLVPNLIDFASAERVLKKIGVLPEYKSADQQVKAQTYGDFLYLVGLENYSQEMIQTIAADVNKAWNDLIVIVIRVPHTEGQLGSINPFFKRYHINIENQKTQGILRRGKTNDDPGVSAELVIRIDPNDQPGLKGRDFPRAWRKLQNRIVRYLDPYKNFNSEYWIMTFDSNQQYEEFLKSGKRKITESNIIFKG